jgi:hypothetical protein
MRTHHFERSGCPRAGCPRCPAVPALSPAGRVVHAPVVHAVRLSPRCHPPVGLSTLSGCPRAVTVTVRPLALCERLASPRAGSGAAPRAQPLAAKYFRNGA